MAPVQSEAGAKTQPASRRLTAVAGYPAVSFQVHTCAACMQGQQRRCFTAPLSVCGQSNYEKKTVPVDSMYTRESTGQSRYG